MGLRAWGRQQKGRRSYVWIGRFHHGEPPLPSTRSPWVSSQDLSLSDYLFSFVLIYICLHHEKVNSRRRGCGRQAASVPCSASPALRIGLGVCRCLVSIC